MTQSLKQGLNGVRPAEAPDQRQEGCHPGCEKCIPGYDDDWVRFWKRFNCAIVDESEE